MTYSQIHIGASLKTEKNGDLFFKDKLITTDSDIVFPNQIINKKYTDEKILELRNLIDLEKVRINNIMEGSDINYDSLKEIQSYIEQLTVNQTGDILTQGTQLINIINTERDRAILQEQALQTNIDAVLAEHNGEIATLKSEMLTTQAHIKMSISDINIIYALRISEIQGILDGYIADIDSKDLVLQTQITTNKIIADTALNFKVDELNNKITQDHTDITNTITNQNINLTNQIVNNTVKTNLLETKHNSEILELMDLILSTKTITDTEHKIITDLMKDETTTVNTRLNALIEYFFRGAIPELLQDGNETVQEIIEFENGDNWELEYTITNTKSSSTTRRIDFQYSDDFSTIISSHTNGEQENGIFIWKLVDGNYILVNPTNIDAMNISGYDNPEGYSISLGNFWFGAGSSFGDDSRVLDMNNTSDFVLTTSVSQGKSRVMAYDSNANKYVLFAEVNISSPYAKYGTISDDGMTVCLREINYVNNIYSYYYKIFKFDRTTSKYEPIFTLPNSNWTYGSIGIFCNNDKRFVIPLKQSQDGLPTLNIYDCDAGGIWSLTKKLEQLPYGYNSIFDITKDGKYIAFSINTDTGSWDRGVRVLKENDTGIWEQYGMDIMLFDIDVRNTSPQRPYSIDINNDGGESRIMVIKSGRKTNADLYKYNNELEYYELYTDLLYPIINRTFEEPVNELGGTVGIHDKFLNTYTAGELNHITLTDNQERMALVRINNVYIYKKYIKE